MLVSDAVGNVETRLASLGGGRLGLAGLVEEDSTGYRHSGYPVRYAFDKTFIGHHLGLNASLPETEFTFNGSNTGSGRNVPPVMGEGMFHNFDGGEGLACAHLCCENTISRLQTKGGHLVLVVVERSVSLDDIGIDISIPSLVDGFALQTIKLEAIARAVRNRPTLDAII